MEVFYLITVIIMVIGFILFKKSENKVNLISISILSIISYLAYNIFICMVFGCIGITTNLLFLSISNIVISAIFGIIIFKDKGIQSFEVRKRDFLAVFICMIIVAYMAVDQYKPLANTVANASVDASMHYSAATNFADNMIILAKIDNTTGYNFKTMQTGAYINTGILMNVLRAFNVKDYISFKLFEIGIIFINVLAFYMLISDKLKGKINCITSMILVLLYVYAFPYISLLYGFSYLSVAICFASGLFYLAKAYDKNEFQFIVELVLIILMGVGIIFSYCLFVPALFSFICLFIFIKGLKKEKNILKVFSKDSLIVTGLLLVVTILSIFYLVIPTFTDSDQNKLTDAIGFDGQNYKGLYIDFIFYVPFVAIFLYKAIKNKKLDYETLALIILLFQTIVSFIGVVKGIVSPYYYFKIYYILWILVVDIAIEVICNSEKELKVGLISGLVLWCIVIYTAISGLEIKLQQKTKSFVTDFRAQSLAGTYFETNILMKNNINVSCIVDQNRVALAEEVGKIEGITLKNMLVGGMNTNHKAWVYVISRIPCGGESINDLQKADVETKVDDWMNNNDKDYFVLFTADKYENTDDYEVVFANNAGVILKKK